MKTKLIALLCAISMLASGAIVPAFAEDASHAAAETITDVEGGEEEKDEVGENGVDENIDEEEADEEDAEESDEDGADVPATFAAGGGSSGGGHVGGLVSTPVEGDNEEDAVDKTELDALLADANAITDEMVSDALFKALAKAADAAQDVADDEEATEAEVREAIDDLEDALEPVTQAIRDALYDILNECKGLDKGIIGAESYSAYEKAYKAASIARWDAEKTGAELYELGAAVKATYAAALADITATEKILSGNVVTAADKEFYPGAESDTLPNLTLSWNITGVLDAPKESATACAQILNGVGLTPYHNQPAMCFGKWDWRGTTNIDMNMGEDAYVTGVDFWENAANETGGDSGNANLCSDRVEVWTSIDGVNWEFRKGVDVDHSDCPNSIKGTRVTLDEAVKCRHVRLAITDKTGNQVRYNEVVLRGYRSAEQNKLPVTFEKIDYKEKNKSGRRLISLDGVDKVFVAGTIVNNSAEELTPCVITAVYKDGDLIDCTYVQPKAAMEAFGGTYEFSNSVTIGGDADVEIYTFVWNDFTEAKALSAIEAFGINEHEMASFKKDGSGAEFDIGSERLTVWGQTGAKSDLNDVTVMVLKAGITAEDMETLTRKQRINAILYLEQTAPASDGGYAFEYLPSDTASMYGNNNVYVTCQTGDRLFYRTLFLDSAGEKAVLAAFHGAKTEEAMRTVLNDYAYLVNGVAAIDEIVAKYDEDETPDTVETSPVFDSVAGMLVGLSFEDAKDVVDQIFAAAALTDLNWVETTEEVIASIDGYCDELGIGSNGIYTELYNAEKNADFKKNVSEGFVNQGYKSIKDFVAQFCNDVVVGLMNSITNYSDVMPILEADRDYLESAGFNFDGYDKLSSSKQQRVQKAVAAKVSGKSSFADLDAIKDTFNDAVKNPGTDKSYGGSYSGGGSSSLGTSVPMTGVTAQDTSVFKDIAGFDWARESILALYQKGIVSGMTENTFAPDDNVTREQFTKMLIAAFELFDANAECDFDDADTEAWYYRYIASAVNSGIVFGVSEDDFGVGENITREDMAVLAYRALVAKGNKVVYDESQISKFTDDAEISEYAREAVYAMRGNSIMLGRGDNEFQPKAFATRAEAAKIIYSIMAK